MKGLTSGYYSNSERIKNEDIRFSINKGLMKIVTIIVRFGDIYACICPVSLGIII